MPAMEAHYIAIKRLPPERAKVLALAESLA